ncbi:MAG: Type 1 glutamine amidotransferase-like domain-containing protein [Anaerolineae bacterium]|jgi:cyanophycinase-like exopeptidase
MAELSPLRRLAGAGWLVLVGGGDWQQSETGEVDSEILVRASLSAPVAYVPAALGSTARGEDLLDYYIDLGGPRGYVVPIVEPSQAREPENCRLLSQAGLIYLDDGDSLQLTQTLWASPALDAMAEAFKRGAMVVGVGAGAAALGAWVLEDPKVPSGGTGWGWLPDIVVVPHFSGAKAAPGLQAALRARPGLLGLGIPRGVALALGPEKRVETWGEGQATVVVAQ